MRKTFIIAALATAYLSMGFSAQAAPTRVDIPFPSRQPSFVPKYTNDPSAWPISMIFLPVLAAFNVVTVIVDAPEGYKHTKQLRRTTAVMAKHAFTGRKAFKEKYPGRAKPKAMASCTVRGNWVGAPCN